MRHKITTALAAAATLGGLAVASPLPASAEPRPIVCGMTDTAPCPESATARLLEMQAENVRLRAAVDKLSQENARLRVENARLRRAVANLQHTATWLDGKVTRFTLALTTPCRLEDFYPRGGAR